MTDIQQSQPAAPVDHRAAKAEAKAAKAYAKAQRPWFKKKRFIIPLAFAVLMVIATATNSGGNSTDATTTTPSTDTRGSAPAAGVETAPVVEEKKKKAPKAVAVTAKAILKEFEDNEAAADAHFDGKTIAVTGIVDRVDTEIFNEDEYVVQIGDGSDYVVWTVNCDDQTNKVAAQIKKGQKVTATGDFEDGGDLGVEMHGCVLS